MEFGIIFIVLDFSIVNKIKILPSITYTRDRNTKLLRWQLIPKSHKYTSLS
jgi:hypothetical protein